MSGPDDSAQNAEALPELLAARRRKLQALREAGVDPFPHAFEDVTPIAEVRAGFAELAARAETGRPAGGQDGRPRPRRPLGPAPAPGPDRRARPGGLRAPDVAGPRRPDRHRRHDLRLQARGAHPPGRALPPARKVAAPTPREVPRTQGRRATLPPARPSTDRQRDE